MYNSTLRDQAEAAARVKAQKKAKKDKWAAEVAQFGQMEAERRQRIEREVRKQADELLTSDIEAMELDEQLTNPNLKISAVLRIDKKLTWSTNIGQKDLNSFNIEDFKLELNSEIKKREGSD